MTDLEKAARMALEALGYYEVAGLATTRVAKSITALRQVLSDSVEQPAQQQKEGFASPGGGYVPAIPRPMPLDWKLVPRKATPEMLKAMDECAQEGYDERLYAGMASSVYMAAWDASPVMGTLPEQPAQQQEWRGPVDWEAVAADYAMTIAMMKGAQEAAVLAEREACAKVLDEMADDMVREMEPSTAVAYVRSKAEAIRARGQA